MKKWTIDTRIVCNDKQKKFVTPRLVNVIRNPKQRHIYMSCFTSIENINA